MAIGRKVQLQITHEISGQGGFGQLTGKLGTFPPGAVAGSYHVITSQAFNSTTNTLSLGTTPGGTDILNAGNIQAVGRLDAVVPIAAAGPYPGDQPVYFTLLSTGTPPTAGVITAWIDYLPGPG
jgi:hypothetical protein